MQQTCATEYEALLVISRADIGLPLYLVTWVMNCQFPDYHPAPRAVQSSKLEISSSGIAAFHLESSHEMTLHTGDLYAESG